MITYQQLWRADPAAWQRAAYGWRRRQPAVERRAAEVAGSARALRAGWSGPAATAADTRLAGLGDRLDAVGPALCVVDQILSRYAEQLARAKAVLADWVATAGVLGQAIDRDGRIGVVRRHGRVQGGAGVRSPGGPVAPVHPDVFGLRPDQRADGVERPVVGLTVRESPRPGCQRGDQHQGRRAGGRQRPWSAG
ncbi:MULTISPECIES: hypothetical protein [unclassified Micromonospora]|uniref:hypothetical protein n=1 Tax=unclassified Micromonospora TaxID=2617518 RepID=UPI003A8361BB